MDTTKLSVANGSCVRSAGLRPGQFVRMVPTSEPGRRSALRRHGEVWLPVADQLDHASTYSLPKYRFTSGRPQWIKIGTMPAAVMMNGSNVPLTATMPTTQPQGLRGTAAATP